MQSRTLAGAALVTAFFAFPLYLLSRSAGAPIASSGGDFPGEGSCANSGCHVGSEPNSGPGMLSISINGTPAAEYRYTPGETASVSVRLLNSQPARTGFQLTARAGDGCTPGGTLMPGELRVRVSSGPCNGGESVQWATHTLAQFGADVSYAVEWTAPMRDIGPVTLAAAGNVANGDGSSRGDSIYHAQVVIQPAEDGGGPAPAISSGGVVLATLAPAVRKGAPNAIASVFGTEFAPAGTGVRNPLLDDNDRIAAVLAETCVEVGGRRAPLFAVFPTQINFQIPDQAGLGPQAVNVIRGCGTANEQRSMNESFTINAAAPAFFLINPNVSQAVAAQRHPALTSVGPADLIPGVTTPARPGEVLILYGTGFGATDPPTAAGEIPGRTEERVRLLATAPGNVQVTIGGMAATVHYTVGAPCCAGLNQLAVQVPQNAPAGELPLILTIDGFPSPAGPFVAVEE